MNNEPNPNPIEAVRQAESFLTPPAEQPAPSDTINVCVGQFPGPAPRKIPMPGTGLTVGKALAIAEITSISGMEVRLDDEPVNMNTPVYNNQTLIVLKPLRANKQ